MGEKLVALVVFLLNIGKITNGFLECVLDSDCVAENSYCDSSMCHCPSGQVFSTTGEECLDLSIGYGSSCTDDNQCSWLLGKHKCSSGQCQCDDGWWYYNGRCVKRAGLGESCDSTSNCFNGYDILAMVCTSGVCECNDGYYLRGNYDCRPLAEDEDDYCSLDSDCAGLGSNYVCSASACVLSTSTTATTSISSNSFLYEFYSFSSSSRTVASESSTRAINVDCTSDIDCSSITNSICYPFTNTCACKRGYFYDENGSCQAELGVFSNCTSDDDCTISPGTCLNGTCYCRKTYFTLPGNSACQKPMAQDNFWCNSVERCYVLGTEVTCRDNECTCSSSAELDDDYICRTVVNGSSSCSTGCDSDSDCTAITNSVCSSSSGECICPDNYRLEDSTTCLPNLGASCDDNSKQCTITHASCTDDLCQCNTNYTAHGNTACYAVATVLGESCEVDEQCSSMFDNSECSSNTCKCLNGYVESEGYCYESKSIGDTCTTALECRTTLGENVYCRKGICQCLATMEATEDGLDCRSSDDTKRLSLYMMLTLFISVLIIT